MKAPWHYRIQMGQNTIGQLPVWELADPRCTIVLIEDRDSYPF